MRFVERLLFYPVVIFATIVALSAVHRHPGPISYAALIGVAVTWLFTFVRSMLWIARILFYLTCVGILATLWTIGPRLTELMRAR